MFIFALLPLLAFQTQLGFAYQDRVAQLGGFYPSFWRLFFKSPALAFAVHAGPFLSYHYRLLGKNTWSGAPERIFNAIANTVYAIGSTPKLWWSISKIVFWPQHP